MVQAPDANTRSGVAFDDTGAGVRKGWGSASRAASMTGIPVPFATVGTSRLSRRRLACDANPARPARRRNDRGAANRPPQPEHPASGHVPRPDRFARLPPRAHHEEEQPGQPKGQRPPPPHVTI